MNSFWEGFVGGICAMLCFYVVCAAFIFFLYRAETRELKLQAKPYSNGKVRTDADFPSSQR